MNDTLESMTPADDELVNTMTGLLSVYPITIILGIAAALLNLPLLYTLIASKKLREDSKLLICLAVADLVNCIGMSLLGFHRYSLYIRSISERMIPLETSLSCAFKPYIWLRLVGNTWPPTIQLLMGIERVIGSTWPLAYVRHLRHRSQHLCAVSMVIAIAFCTVGFVISISNVSGGYVKFDCGRRATFSVLYAQSVYFWEMMGYVIGMLLSITAYIKAKSRIKSTHFREQLKRIPLCLALGMLSTVLVVIPDIKSLFVSKLPFEETTEWVSQIINWASIIKSSINIFMYLWLYREFRHEFFRLFKLRRMVHSVTVVEVQYRKSFHGKTLRH